MGYPQPEGLDLEGKSGLTTGPAKAKTANVLPVTSLKSDSRPFLRSTSTHEDAS
jgi:hypothetical protein